MKKLTGIVICFIIAVVAWLLGMKFPVVGGPVFGILIGMVTAKLVDVSSFREGIVLTAKKLLQFSIILLGFEMNLSLQIRPDRSLRNFRRSNIHPSYISEQRVLGGGFIHLVFRSITD